MINSLSPALTFSAKCEPGGGLPSVFVPCPAGLLELLVSEAWKTIHVVINTGKAVSQMSVHEVSGVRLMSVRELAVDQITLLRFRCLMLCMACTGYLCSWFLKCPRTVHDPQHRPPIFDLLNGFHTPVTVALQYYGALIVGTAHSLVIPWAPGGHASMMAGIRAEPETARLFRVGCYMASS